MGVFCRPISLTDMNEEPQPADRVFSIVGGTLDGQPRLCASCVKHSIPTESSVSSEPRYDALARCTSWSINGTANGGTRLICNPAAQIVGLLLGGYNVVLCLARAKAGSRSFLLKAATIGSTRRVQT